MKIDELQTMLDDFNNKIDDIVSACENMSSEGITIDISTEDGKKKFSRIQAKLQNFTSSIENRIKGLKNKIVKSLNKTYNEATTSMEPYKTIADAALQLTAPGADLGKLASFASSVVDLFQKIGEHYTAQYTKPYETVVAITGAATQLSSSLSKLSNLSLPVINVIDNGKTAEWQAPTPEIPSIGLSDITSGTEEPESTKVEEPNIITIPKRRYSFSSYEELIKYPITWIGPFDLSSVPLVGYDYIYKDEDGDDKYNMSVMLDRKYIFECETTILGLPKHKGSWKGINAWHKTFVDEEDFRRSYENSPAAFIWSGPTWIGFNPQMGKNREVNWTRIRLLKNVFSHTITTYGEKPKTETVCEWGNEYKNLDYLASRSEFNPTMVDGSNYWIS